MVEVVRTGKCNWIGVFDHSGGRFWCELRGGITSAMFGNGTRPMGGWAATVGSGPVWDQHPYTAGSKPLNGKAASWRTLLAASMVPFSPEPRHLCYLTLSHVILSLVAKR